MASPPVHLQNSVEVYSDTRARGYQGPSRYLRYPRATSPGGGCITKSEDGVRCAVAGKESLRILRISDGSLPGSSEFRSNASRAGHRVDVTRNLWEGCALKIESATTGIAWGRGSFSNKLFTSARNGELIMWDVSRAGSAKLERRTKDHIRSINQLAISHSVHHYCVTGSADGDLRIWDLRDMSKSLMRVHHPTSVRSVAFSPSLWQPLQAIVGLDNGSIYRWDLKMGQRGQLDRLLVAHTTSVTSLAWRNSPGSDGQTGDSGLGWFASGALDRCIKVWDLTSPGSTSHIPARPSYTLHPRYPVRQVLWRPGYDCEIAVVSNPEFAASKSDVSHLTPPFMSRPSSAHGLDNLGQVPESEVQNVPMMENKVPGVAPQSPGGTIEIWDVRRGWIAKWSVRGSGADGSMTDVDFADSHAIWAVHSSGGFSQFDLRDTYKPIETVPRVALTWEASGSITFVSDSSHRFEVPYDDILTEAKPLAEKLRVHVKALGDPSAQPQLQNIGTQLLTRATADLQAFKKLAQVYTLTGENRKLICIKNARAAIEAGQEDSAQLWLLLAACLEEVMPPIPIPPILSQVASPQGMHALLPTSASGRYTQSYFPLGGKSPEGNHTQKISPGRRSTNSNESPKYGQQRSSSRPASRHLTPASSASSSPRHGYVHLPPITPRRSSFFSHRSSIDPSARHPSSYRRPSIASPAALATASPAPEKDRVSSGSSHRHVGEGALDDSDSSSGNDSDVGSAGTAGNWTDDETNFRPPLTSPTFLLQRSVTAPSPLSRVAGRHHYTEEEGGGANDDEASSPSPQSTDSELDGPVPVSRRQSIGRRVSGRYKSRSRSSTVACLAAPTPDRGLTRQASASSVRTVVAGDVTHGDAEEGSYNAEGTIRDLNSHLSEDNPVIPTNEAKQEPVADPSRFTERRIEIVQAEEKRIKDGCLHVLRQALDALADNGDIQMCAMLVIVARAELLVSIRRSVSFVDAYVDKLDRLRLFACSAYVRKHCQLKDIQSTTMTHTSISTSCGRCHKPLLKPSGRLPDGTVAKGGYSHCLTCKAYVSCAICRLPVRTLFFQCPVCKHGAHENCHRQFYEHHRLSKPSITKGGVDYQGMRRRTASRDSYDSSSPGEGPGYPCPTGCGHHCFIRSSAVFAV